MHDMRGSTQGLADARVCLTGEITPVAADSLPPLKALYKQRHPGSFWVDFGDFHWFQMTNIAAARVVGGFARAGSVRCSSLRRSVVTPAQPIHQRCVHHP